MHFPNNLIFSYSPFVIKLYFTEADSPKRLLSDPNLCIYDFICVFMILSMKLKLADYCSFCDVSLMIGSGNYVHLSGNYLLISWKRMYFLPKYQIYSGAVMTSKTFHYPNDPKFSDRQVWANRVDQDQTRGAVQSDQGWAVWSGSTLFAIPTALFGPKDDYRNFFGCPNV